MASITIRNLDDEIKQRLRVRAAEHGRSMEEEADLELPAREPMREPPQLGCQPR
jgi:plasmid stability protein